MQTCRRRVSERERWASNAMLVPQSRDEKPCQQSTAADEGRYFRSFTIGRLQSMRDQTAFIYKRNIQIPQISAQRRQFRPNRDGGESRETSSDDVNEVTRDLNQRLDVQAPVTSPVSSDPSSHQDVEVPHFRINTRHQITHESIAKHCQSLMTAPFRPTGAGSWTRMGCKRGD